MNFKYAIMNFMKRNGGTILTFLSAAGVVGTSISSGIAAVKADKKLKALGENASFLEKFKTVAPIYILPTGIGAATIACMFGANGFNRRQQASMLAAGALVEETFRRYKDKAEELLGDSVVDANIAKDQEPPSVNEEEHLFYYEYYTDKDHLENGSYFTSTVENVLKAEMELNRIYILRKAFNPNNASVTLNEFFRLLGKKEVDGCDKIGWSQTISDEFLGYSWIDFEHVDTTLLDGLECTIISHPKHLTPSILA